MPSNTWRTDAEGSYITIFHAQKLSAANSGLLWSSPRPTRGTDAGKSSREFGIRISFQSKNWNELRSKMEKPEDFVAVMKEGDHFLSFDVYKGYRILCLNPLIWDSFIFK